MNVAVDKTLLTKTSRVQVGSQGRTPERGTGVPHGM